jgi:hypothetical protein
MNWTTLYITGRSDFREDVHKKLEGSRLEYMPGYIEGSAGAGIYDLFWIDDSIALKDIKEAVGSKLIWKYRLRFYNNLEDFIQSVNLPPTEPDWSDDEKKLLTAMRQSA